MERHQLSKSTFIRGVQCLKSLYLNKKRPFLRDRLPKERLLVFQRGHKVGDLAQQIFPGGVDMSPGHPSAYRKAVFNTSQKISEGYPVIYEAAFQYDGVLILLDILVKAGAGWHAYEVKSSGGISDTYLMDAALQYYVIKGTGLDIKKISLVHINRDYVLEGELEPAELFTRIDVTEEAIKRQDFVISQIVKSKEAIALSHSPKIDVGGHCREPYDCDFIGHCWKNVPEKPESPIDKQFNLHSAKSMLSEAGNVAFLKILPMRPALPMYQGTHPYQSIAYAYGIMGMEKSDVVLFPGSNKPETDLILSLREKIIGFDTIICLGQKDKINALIGEAAKIIDLMDFFLPENTLWKVNEGESFLKKVFDLSGTDHQLPVYNSDSVCEHYYLTEFEDPEVKNKLSDYCELSCTAIRSIYNYLKTK